MIDEKPPGLPGGGKALDLTLAEFRSLKPYRLNRVKFFPRAVVKPPLYDD